MWGFGFTSISLGGCSGSLATDVFIVYLQIELENGGKVRGMREKI